MSFDDYCEQVRKALAPFGATKTDDELRERYKYYCTIDEAFGAGDISAERDASGKVQTYVALKARRAE